MKWRNLWQWTNFYALDLFESTEDFWTRMKKNEDKKNRILFKSLRVSFIHHLQMNKFSFVSAYIFHTLTHISKVFSILLNLKFLMFVFSLFGYFSFGSTASTHIHTTMYHHSSDALITDKWKIDHSMWTTISIMYRSRSCPMTTMKVHTTVLVNKRHRHFFHH